MRTEIEEIKITKNIEGSEKQIVWANQIVDESVENVNRIIGRANMLIAEGVPNHYKNVTKLIANCKIREGFDNLSKLPAHQIISNRNHIGNIAPLLSDKI